MTHEKRILTADDHPIFREGITRIIEKEKDFKIVASVGDGTTALEQIRKLKPAVAILDISMPGISGLAIARIIRDEELPVSPIILTMYHEEEYLEEALELGVTGYLLKDSTLMEIVDCIKTVLGGGYFISKELTRIML
ncbi:MAG: response regulator transcription factor [Ignavibacteriales bacterium]|nr:response regulator transcription factor [Ignavibacteriales bacterium]